MKLRTKRLSIVIAVASAFMATAATAQEVAATAPLANPAPTTDAQPAVPVAEAASVDQTPAPEVKQSAAAASAAAKSGGIQTVVVTAQKRKEDASKVPLSISVLGGDELTSQHIGDYADITRAIPNISFSGGGGGGDAGDGPGLSNIEIRGISSSAGAATVGIYMDDVSMTVANLYSMGSAEPKFFDLDHVEILRGPQGTLYGSSSMGGTIKFITNQPNLKEQTTDVYTEFSSFKGGKDSYTGNVVFNQPLTPGELALRVGIQGGHQGGYIDQVNANGNVIDSGINWQDDSVLHLAMKWAPTKNLTITPSVFYQKVKTGDTDVSYTQVLESGQQNGIILPPYQTSKIMHEPGSDELLVPSLTISYGTDLGDLTAVTSYFKRTFSRIQDGSETNSVQLGTSGSYIDNVNYPAFGAAVAALPSAVTLNNQVAQFSQEIRFASKQYEPGGSPITWLVGAYAANEHTSIIENDYVYGLNKTFSNFGLSPTDPTVFVPGTYLPGFPSDNTFAGGYKFHDTQQSIFGEMSYYFVPTVHATVGLRYLHAQEVFSSFQSLFYNGGNTTNDSTQSGNKSTPKLSVIWEVSPTSSVFASAAEGFRVGGNNDAVPATLCGLPGPNPLSFNSDSLWSYEVGNKSRFLDNKVTFNSSLFYVKWKNMQQEIELPCSFDYNVNVGSATSYGAEVELKVKPISSLLIDLAGGYTHATLDNSDGAETGVAGAVAGANIPGVPRYNIALTTTYNYDITDNYFGFLRGAARWTGASNGGFSELPNSNGTITPPNLFAGVPNPDFNRPAYHTIDASTGVSWGAWEATLFVKNMFNNNMIIQRPIVQATLGEVYRMEPRTIGMSLSAKF
ncbi:TonB-dependent receptor [Solimicrobium silvestre]|uniref:TonB-dependent Receptor Plug Domain n=1 Tax=Solimicrobium silvestre TaxID=2099400 RepID=A0A2S9GZP9_9BURK|nr:TonB-dependent receptor [Solimicrobium silvestre]PRC93212.1 TonB-dependent Receptor Plug Domain [Solimicrobium silvestre]